jgi:hypothetical protein
VIGTRLTERETGAEWEVVGADGGQYVLRRVDVHAAPESVPLATLATRFDVDDPEPPAVPDEAAGWDALADANTRAALRLVRGESSDAPTPEDIFRDAR